jgi:hypothetical protein
LVAEKERSNDNFTKGETNMAQISINELQKMVENKESVEINPDGSIKKLTALETLEKRLKLEREINECLILQIQKLKYRLEQIRELTKP